MKIGGLDAILLAHGHRDYIYDLDLLKADFKETPIYVFEGDIDFLKEPVLNCSVTNGFRLFLHSEPEAVTEEEFDLFPFDKYAFPHTEHFLLFFGFVTSIYSYLSSGSTEHLKYLQIICENVISCG